MFSLVVVVLLVGAVVNLVQTYVAGRAHAKKQSSHNSGCALPGRLGSWTCEGERREIAQPGERCSFVARGLECGAGPTLTASCNNGRLSRLPHCFSEFAQEDALVAKGAAVEKHPAMRRFRAEVLKPERPDTAVLDELCKQQEGAIPHEVKQHGTVPRIGHVVTGAGESWTFGHHLHVLAALKAWRLDRVYVHHVGEVDGFWWRELKHPRVTKRPHEPVTSIFGHRIVLPQHAADILRLEALMEFGGVYFDTDVFALRSIDDLLLLEQRTSIAVERPHGLINAFIVAPRNASFIRRWYKMYHARGVGCWNCASVVWPPRLALVDPCGLRVLPTRDLLLKGQYSPRGLARVSLMSVDFSGMRGVHFFSNRGGCFFKTVSPSDLVNPPNVTYFRMLRAVFGAKELTAMAERYAGCSPTGDCTGGEKSSRDEMCPGLVRSNQTATQSHRR